jgi:pyruvate/2-oxoglutarate dehydrogenase complex dihydrolipoamide acyltransferase (E2) component
MTQTRIYVALLPDAVRRLAAEREIGPAPVAAFGVTERIERADPTGLEEEWEYAALTEAAEAAAVLQGTTVAKRVVAAADVDPGTVAPDGTRDSLAAVTVSSAVSLRQVVSFHVDEEAGDQGMEDLLWYDATELDEVLRLL